jgi:hypothetical protein
MQLVVCANQPWKKQLFLHRCFAQVQLQRLTPGTLHT